MVRALRVEYEGAFYHVMNRGRGRQRIFHDDRYYEAFVNCLEQAHQRFALEIHAYCLMGNHYHLLVRTPRANLSRAMRHINGLYTQAHNRLRRTDGPLFRGRYKAINVEASAYLLEVSRYVHRNPVEIRQPLVAELEQYAWSSYPAYRNRCSTPAWLYKDAVFAELASGQPTAAYGRFVDRGLDEETQKFYAKSQWPPVRGKKAFVESAYLRALSTGRELSRNRQLVDFDLIVDRVALRCASDRSQILVGRRGRGKKQLERWVAMKLAYELTGESQIELAERFGVSSYSTVSATIARLGELLREDQGVFELYNSISQDLTP